MKIRMLCPEDWDVFHDMMRRLHLLYAENRPDLFRADADPFPRQEEFQKLLENSDEFTLVAEEDGKMIGFCSMKLKYLSDPLLYSKVIAHIGSLYVDENYRNQGVGRTLLEQTRGLAKEYGADIIQLKVWAFNQTAARFYQSLGMKIRNLTMEETL